MAQDQRQPNTAPPLTAPDSPYYTKDNMPRDTQPDAAWLLNKGCKCLGHPNADDSAWLLAGASETEESHREPKIGYRRKVTGRDQGGPIVEVVQEQLMEQDGSNPNNMGQPTRPITQLVVTPPAKMIHRRLAVELMQAREAKARRDAAAAKAA